MFSIIQYTLAVLSNKVSQGTQIILWLSCFHFHVTRILYIDHMHCRPCLWQAHLALAQSDEQLHLIISRSDSGAAGRSVIRGSTWPSVTFHPLSSNDMPSFSPFHCFTCRYTLRRWCRAADVGGRFWTIGCQFLTVALLAHAVWFLPRFSSVERYQHIFSSYHDIIDCGRGVENLCLLSEV